MERSLLPFYFPTNIILLDDDPGFLKHFSLLLDPALPCVPFSSASAALQAVNQQAPISSYFKELINITLQDDTEERTYVDLNKLHKLVYREDRFSRLSVVIIDYDMPEMTGLEVSRNIQHTEIKKILLTGKADEKIAVEAFNAGLIHQYIQKSITNVDVQLNAAVKKLQHEYFREITKPIQIALTDRTASYLADPKFKTEFSKLLDANGYVEFYLFENPRGVLLLDNLGNSGFLFVMSRDVMETHHEIAQTYDAPSELLDLLKDNCHVPGFPTADGYFTSACKSDWRSYLYEASFACNNAEQDLCAMVIPAPPTVLDTARVRSYQAYLESFDAGYFINS